MQEIREKKAQLKEVLGDVTFETTATLDSRGILKAFVKIKKSGNTGRCSVQTAIDVISNGKIIYHLESEKTTLSGIIVSAFVPGKRSSFATQLTSSMSFDDITSEPVDVQSVDKQMQPLDKEISMLAADLRQKKILSSKDDSEANQELVDMALRLHDLKEKRVARQRELTFFSQFSSLELSIKHSCN